MRHQFAWLAWPFGAVALILGYYAWRLYDVEGAETIVCARRERVGT